MKINSNLFLTTALAATLSAIVACAPAKRGAKFADMSGPNSGSTDLDRFGKTANTPEAKELNSRITYVDGMIEEAVNSKMGRAALTKAYADRSKNKVSGIPLPKNERGAAVDDNAAVAERQPKNRRQEYLITVRIAIDGVGALDYMAFNDEFGSETNLVELLPADDECASKVANFLSVRGACVDRACTTLAIQIADVSGDTEVKVNKFLDRLAPPEGELIKTTRFNAVFATPSTEETPAQPIKPQMACKKDEAASPVSATPAAEALTPPADAAPASPADDATSILEAGLIE